MMRGLTNKSMESQEKKIEQTMTGTRDLFLETLTKIGSVRNRP